MGVGVALHTDMWGYIPKTGICRSHSHSYPLQQLFRPTTGALRQRFSPVVEATKILGGEIHKYLKGCTLVEPTYSLSNKRIQEFSSVVFLFFFTKYFFVRIFIFIVLRY